jgi:hypothetical protein
VSTDDDGNVEDAPVRADAKLLFNNDPTAPTDPDPSIADGATDVSLNPALSVTVNDPDEAPVDVFFYDSSDNLIGSDLGVVSGSTASVVWSGLSGNTQYGWYVVVDDSLGSSQSQTWTFTTLGDLVSVPAMNATATVPTAFILILAGMVMIRRKQL